MVVYLQYCQKLDWCQGLLTAALLALLTMSAVNVCAQQSMQSLPDCPAKLLNKKVAVIMGPAKTSVNQQSFRSELFDQIRVLLEGKLLALSFEPIDQALLESQLSEKQKQLLLHGDVIGAANLVNQLGADLLLFWQLASQPQKMTSLDTKMVSVSLQFSLKLVAASSAKVLAGTQLIDKTAGLDAETAIIKLLNKKVDGLVSDILHQYCAKALILSEETEPSAAGVDSSTETPQPGNAQPQPPKFPAEDGIKSPMGGSVNEL